MDPSITPPSAGGWNHGTDKPRLRAELKKWERDFQKQHGHKPNPADIKADPVISKKYKHYHRLFRMRPPSHPASRPVVDHLERPQPPIEFVSTSIALKTVTPQKRTIAFQNDSLTPTKRILISGASLESIGPTPQHNGRMLGIFHGIQDQTPIAKRRKVTWGEQLAEARRESPLKSTPRKRLLITSPTSVTQVTPTKSHAPTTRFSTPVSQSVSLCNEHAFATPAFLRPTAVPVQSPQSPSLLKIPRQVKGLSALISDFRANRDISLDKIDQDIWEDEEDIAVVREHDSPGVAGRKPWTKKGVKRSKRRVIMRPVPALEIPASDDEAQSPGPPADKFRSIPRVSPEIDQIEAIRGDPRSAGSDIEAETVQKPPTTTRKPKDKGGLKSNKSAAGPGKTKQVSGNFVKLQIRSKGRRSQGRFGVRTLGR